tara:strand:- start:39 stop:143 length:105 start_codon:yes stop_codon:yes gene_type:complete
MSVVSARIGIEITRRAKMKGLVLIIDFTALLEEW